MGLRHAVITADAPARCTGPRTLHRNPGTYVLSLLLDPHHHLHIHGVELLLRRVAGKFCFCWCVCMSYGTCPLFMYDFFAGNLKLISIYAMQIIQ